MRKAYSVCLAPEDYARCRAYQEQWHPEWEAEDPLHQYQYCFPTVMAWHDGALLGFLATGKVQGLVTAGPLCILPSLSSKAFVVRGLWFRYEQLLRQAGITYYFFHVRADNPWQDMIERMGFHERLATNTPGYCWYRRTIP
jgi:hypothetical protein